MSLSRIPLDLLSSVRYDPESGAFFWIVKTGIKTWVGKRADVGNDSGYRVIHFRYQTYLAHQVVCFLFGISGEGEIDHINGMRFDNRVENLRLVSRAENQQNRRTITKANTTGFQGVHKKGRRFLAQITISNKNKHLGYFDTPEEAHEAYITAKRVLHKGNTL